MPRISDQIKSVWSMVCKFSDHIVTVYKWYMVLFVILPGVCFYTGLRIGGISKVEQDKKIFNQMVNAIVERNHGLIKEVRGSGKSLFNLSGNWEYEAHDISNNNTNRGNVKIRQDHNGELEVEGYRIETENDTGNIKKINPPKEWRSMWGKITSQGIKIEYLININEDDKNLGYIMINPPRPPFKELNGFYYIFRPNLITGDIVFMKH